MGAPHWFFLLLCFLLLEMMVPGGFYFASLAFVLPFLQRIETVDTREQVIEVPPAVRRNLRSPWRMP